MLYSSVTIEELLSLSAEQLLLDCAAITDEGITYAIIKVAKDVT